MTVNESLTGFSRESLMRCVLSHETQNNMHSSSLSLQRGGGCLGSAWTENSPTSHGLVYSRLVEGELDPDVLVFHTAASKRNKTSSTEENLRCVRTWVCRVWCIGRQTGPFGVVTVTASIISTTTTTPSMTPRPSENIRMGVLDDRRRQAQQKKFRTMNTGCTDRGSHFPPRRTRTNHIITNNDI